MPSKADFDAPAAAADGPSPAEMVRLKDLALSATAEGITISDVRRPDNPIVYANLGFEELTGYSVRDVLGRNCRFLQGPDTDPRATRKIREAIESGTPCTVDLLNYRKDGSAFWNRLAITPVRGADGELTHFVGVQSDVTPHKRVEAELAGANRRMSESLAAAAEIQRSLLPEAMPEVPGLDFAWCFDPCDELAGDSLDVFPIDRERLAFYVLDVSGHGVPAALLSVTLAQILSFSRRQAGLPGRGSFADRRLVASPKAAVERLNQLFPMRADSRQYFTLFYGVLHLPSRTLRYVSAGHPAPVRVTRDGRTSHLQMNGFPVGLAREPEYEEGKVRLEPGDRLYLYTDGLLEAADAAGLEFGARRLAHEVTRGRRLALGESVEALERAAKEWASGPLTDDLSILAIEIDESARSEVSALDPGAGRPRLSWLGRG